MLCFEGLLALSPDLHRLRREALVIARQPGPDWYPDFCHSSNTIREAARAIAANNNLDVAEVLRVIRLGLVDAYTAGRRRPGFQPRIGRPMSSNRQPR